MYTQYQMIGRRYSAGLSSPFNPISTDRHIAVASPPTSRGGAFALSQHFLLDWDMLRSVGEFHRNREVGRDSRNQQLVGAMNLRTHVRRARLIDPINGTTRLLVTHSLPFGSFQGRADEENGAIAAAQQRRSPDMTYNTQGWNSWDYQIQCRHCRTASLASQLEGIEVTWTSCSGLPRHRTAAFGIFRALGEAVCDSLRDCHQHVCSELQCAEKSCSTLSTAERDSNSCIVANNMSAASLYSVHPYWDRKPENNSLMFYSSVEYMNRMATGTYNPPALNPAAAEVKAPSTRILRCASRHMRWLSRVSLSVCRTTLS